MTMACSIVMPRVMENFDDKCVVHSAVKFREHCAERFMEQFDEKCHGTF